MRQRVRVATSHRENLGEGLLTHGKDNDKKLYHNKILAVVLDHVRLW